MLTVVLLLAVIIAFWHPLVAMFRNPLRAREVIASAGPLGPLVFIGMQIAQVIIAPIPGQVTGFVGGFLFGAVWGTVYTMVGLTLGSTFVFWLARRLGRPFVERFVKKETVDRFDYLAHKHGVIVLFFIFLLPFFPDDMVCYIAGLTRIRLRSFLVATTVGRLPSVFAINLAASGLAESKLRQVVAVVLVAAVVVVVCYWQRKRVEQLIRRLSS